MARYTGADCKLCRREKMKLFLKGSKCDSPKCPIESRPYPPGQHGRNRPKESEYLGQIREKQKARRIYGILERQFHGYYEEASRKRGKTGENLLQILERRLQYVGRDPQQLLLEDPRRAQRRTRAHHAASASARAHAVRRG